MPQVSPATHHISETRNMYKSRVITKKKVIMGDFIVAVVTVCIQSGNGLMFFFFYWGLLQHVQPKPQSIPVAGSQVGRVNICITAPPIVCTRLNEEWACQNVSMRWLSLEGMQGYLTNSVENEQWPYCVRTSIWLMTVCPLYAERGNCSAKGIFNWCARGAHFLKAIIH